MAQTEHHPPPIIERGVRRDTAKVLAGGSSVEGLAGAGAVTLSILGLAGVLPVYMVTIATIAVGVGLLLEGATIASRTSEILSRLGDTRTEEIELMGGVSVEFVGGAAGIVLGILSLLGVATMVLVASAALIFGGTLLLSTGTRAALNRALAQAAAGGAGTQHAMQEAMSASAGSRALIGIATAVLGLLVLADVGAPLVLALVAMLGTGASILLSGSTLSGRVATALRH